MSSIEQLITDELRAQAEAAVPPSDAGDRFAESIEPPTTRVLDVDSGEADVDEAGFDDLKVDSLRRPEDRIAPTDQRRRNRVVAAAAATILVVVGVVVVADGISSDVVTDQVSTPSVADPAASSSPAEPLPYQWSRVPHDEAVFGGAGGQAMNSVTVGGPGLVAVGVGAGLTASDEGNVDGQVKAAVWTSADGITWSRVPHDEAVFGGLSGQWMNSVAVGGPGLVAVGSDGRFSDLGYETTTDGGWYWWEGQAGAAAVWTSVDGISWSRVPHDEAVFGAEADQVMNSVTAGGPGLVAVGSVESGDDAAAAVWTSVDGITWSRVAHDEAVFGGVGERMSSVTPGGPGLVAVGGDWSDAVVWTSVDGITWSRVPHDEAVFGDADGRGGQGMSSVVAADSGLVAVGSDQHGDDVPSGRAHNAAVWTSVDGITWSRVPHDEEVFGGTGNQRMHSVTDTGTGVVAVGADGGFYDTRSNAAVWTSVDAITWSRLPHDEAIFGGAEMHSATVAGSGLVAVGDESLETRGSLSRQEAIESGDSVLAWVATPPD